MLTLFVNIHAHSSIKHAMRNSRVTGTIAKQKFLTIGDATQG